MSRFPFEESFFGTRTLETSIDCPSIRSFASAEDVLLSSVVASSETTVGADCKRSEDEDSSFDRRFFETTLSVISTVSSLSISEERKRPTAHSVFTTQFIMTQRSLHVRTTHHCPTECFVDRPDTTSNSDTNASNLLPNNLRQSKTNAW